MELRIKVTSNAAALAQAFDALRLDQVPFATAHALTLTAKAIQEAERKALPEHFTIRRPRVAKGIQMRSATKRTLEAVVGSVDPFMLLQEEGGTKERHDKAMAIPLSRTAGGGIRGQGGLKALTPSLWPHALPKTFILRSKHGPVVAQRFGREPKKRVAGQRALRVVYGFRGRVRIKPRWGFVKRVEAVARPTFDRFFLVAYAQAIETARP